MNLQSVVFASVAKQSRFLIAAKIAALTEFDDETTINMAQVELLAREPLAKAMSFT